MNKTLNVKKTRRISFRNESCNAHLYHTQEEVEKKRLQQLEKKAEAKALLEKEMANIKVGGKQPASKITRAEIVTITEKRNQVAMKKKEEDKPIEENLNRLILEGETAHGIDEAISVLR